MSVPNKYFYINYTDYKKIYLNKKISSCTICKSAAGFIKRKSSKLRTSMGQELIRCRTCSSLIVVQKELPPEIKRISEEDQESYWNYLENRKKQNSILKIN